jgi:hypothetical protein
MASSARLRSRRSAGQRHALAGVEREIRTFDQNGRRKYLQDFTQAFRSYEVTLDACEVGRAVRDADLLLIGDYHALPAAQNFAEKLLENRASVGDRPVVLGLETIFSRDQHILEEWFDGEIDEAELRERIRFDFDWGYDWAPFYQLLETAREHSDGIYGLDCMPREDLRKIGARDRHAADKIAEIRDLHPDAAIFVLFGESHLAPQHLPEVLRERLPKERTLTVLQNVDALYWRAAGEPQENVEAVRVEHDILCVFNATPLEKYESYRLYLERWRREEGSGPDLGPTMYNLIEGLLRFLNINRYSSHNTTQPKFLVDLMPEVYSRESDSTLRRLLSRKGVGDEEREVMLSRVEARGCAYLPAINAFYVREFRMMHATEDAARFLHQACRGLPHRLTAQGLAQLGSEDAFYSTVLENALGYLGSRVLYPARPALHESDLSQMYDMTREDIEHETGLHFDEAVAALDVLLLHRGWEKDSASLAESPQAIREAIERRGEGIEYLTANLGQLLGSDLYDAYLDGRLTRTALRHIFLTHLEQPGQARTAYFSLVRNLRCMKKPCGREDQAH